MKSRKIKIICMLIIFAILLFISNIIYATDDCTDKLYQDITINADGSITVREAAVLTGEYNGRSREIRFRNTSSNTFTGIYSNFSGNTDIYDGTSIKDIKIYDVSQNNFNSIKDMNKIEKEYKKVDSAKNGKYGVYTLSKSRYDAEFKIYCPSKKKKVFFMEYTITDAVVIHNDVAELYWNVIGSNYREKINDFQVIVHLPGEDNDLRVWTHGPLTGSNKILDNRTLSFKDQNVKAYEAETIRVMFNKNLVPNGTKLSEVDGKAYILKYEEAMANAANYEREQEKYDDINYASQAVIDLEEYPSIYRYNRALKYTKELTDTTIKNEFMKRIKNLEQEVNANWKESVEYKIDTLNYSLNRSNISRLKESIEEGFDESAKAEYMKYVDVFTKKLDERDAVIRKVLFIIVAILYGIFTIVIIFKLVKLHREKTMYKGKYFREFPSDENPYVIEYIMKGKTTNLSISATILNLITKKVIEIENESEDNIKFILKEKGYKGTECEKIVLDILFTLVGSGGICRLKELKEYGKTEYKAKGLTTEINKFRKAAKLETEAKGYFERNKSNKLIQILIILNYIFTLFMSIGIFKNTDNGLDVIKYLGIITLVSIVFSIITNKDKKRTEKGKQEYSKWLAHKRFLKDFSMLDERELPEIELWEKYLVTATILGCADKVQSKMKMYINNYDTSTNYPLISSVISNDFIKNIDRSIDRSISTASFTISTSNTSSSGGSSGGRSSGGGFGGGSSGGGGRRWPEAAVEVVSKNRNTDFKIKSVFF